MHICKITAFIHQIWAITVYILVFFLHCIKIIFPRLFKEKNGGLLHFFPVNKTEVLWYLRCNCHFCCLKNFDDHNCHYSEHAFHSHMNNNRLARVSYCHTCVWHWLWWWPFSRSYIQKQMVVYLVYPVRLGFDTLVMW